MATTKKAIAEAEQAAEIKETIAAPTTEPGTPAVTLDELESMDMNMFDAEETESAPRPAWRITDDGCADWACRKIAEEKTELDRITALGENQIEKIQQRIDAAQRRYENGTRFLTGKLAEYFETVPHKTSGIHDHQTKKRPPNSCIYPERTLPFYRLMRTGKQRKREKDRDADRKIDKERAHSRGLCSGNLSGDRLHGSEARSQRSGAFTGRNKQAATPDRPAGSRR